MSENKPRELEEIQKEYQETCFKAGQVQYQIDVLTKELKTLNEKLYSVNVEAAQLNKKDDSNV
jgi:hypothetical protein